MGALNDNIRRMTSLSKEFITSVPERKRCDTLHRARGGERASQLSQEAEKPRLQTALGFCQKGDQVDQLRLS